MPQLEILEEIRSGVFDKFFKGEKLIEILESILHSIERKNKNMLCSILLLDEEGKHLLSTAAPRLPKFYVDAINGGEIGLGVGSCGTAAYTGESVIAEDIQTHPYWEKYKILAKKAGLASCWSEPIKNENGRVLGTFAIYHNKIAHPTNKHILLIKQLAKIVAVTIKHFDTIDKLKTSEQKYRQMFEDNPQPMYIFDLETFRFLNVNHAIQELYGYSQEEFLNMVIFDIRPKEDRPVLKKFLKSRLHSKSNLLEAGYWRHLKKNGELVYVQVSYQPILFNNRKAGYVLINDISVVRNAEIRLKNSENRLFTILETIPDCVTIMGLSGKLHDINQAGLSLFEVETKEQLLGRSVLDFVEKPFQESFRAFMKGISKGNNEDFEFKIIGAKGSSRWVETHATLLKLEDGSRFILSVLHNLTGEKESQLLLKQQNEALKKSNSELDRFVYSTSHDLRSPLSSMMGLAKIIQSETREAETYEHIQMIQNRIKRLDHLIKDILSYSFNKRTEIVPSHIDFDKVVSNTFENLEHIETTKKIAFEITIDKQTPFHSDLQRIYTILENLVGNAIKYHNPLQEKPFVKISVLVGEKEATITIEDNGIGIEKDLQPKIFDMFYRISNNQEGSGIGLYLVHETVKNIGGKISLISEPGIGSIFTIVLKNYLYEAPN